MAEARSRELPEIPELAEDYELVRELGRGGTAVVYLARDRELGRDVAIKLIRPSYLHDEDAVARLLREAHTVGKLQHPNIVLLLGTKRLGKHGLALILQYVTGSSLKARIQEGGPLSLADAERVLRDIGKALEYAHTQRIVHRDIKPENVYLDDAAGVARLADFGIARAWDSDSGLTLPGTAIGTPAYMSPEQVEGEELDGRSDLYSLGLVGYEMLTGSQPWAGESLYSVIYKQRNEQLPAISSLRPEVPENLVRAIEGCIKKDPEERWSGAKDFLAALAKGSELPEVPAGSDAWGRASGVSLEAVEAAMAAGASVPAAAPSAKRAPTQAVGDALGGAWTPRPRAKPRWGRRLAFGVVALVVVGTGLSFLGGGSGSVVDRAASVLGGARTAVLGADASGDDGVRAGSGAADTRATSLDGAAGSAQVSVDGIASPSSADANAPVAGPPAAVQVLGGDQQAGEPGTTLPLPLVLRVTDAGGQPVAGAEVGFEVASGGGVTVPSSAETGVDGAVITRWTLGIGGEDQVLQARVEGSEIAEVTFVASLRTDDADVLVPSRAEILGGGGQIGDVGEALPEGLALRVVDDEGTPVGGASVRFQIEGGGGQVSPQLAVTDADGIARSQWILGSAPGAQSLSAVVDGAESVAVTFLATAVGPSRLAVTPSVVTGGNHSCSLRSDGSMVCWGGNTFGQLGDGSSGGRLVPSLSVRGDGFASASAGLAHVCALSAEGEVFCWGANDQGQLGNGGSAGASLPTPVAGSARFVDVAAGQGHTCALGSDGVAYCWGTNGSGQIGDGSRDPSNAPVPVVSSVPFRQIVAGWRHSCAVDTSGRAYCWGANDSGQLGAGGGDASLPRQVGGGYTFQALAAGNAHTCGLMTDGGIVCWGANDQGQLGDGTTQDRSEPAPVSTAATFAAVASGGVHTCALSSDGGAMCWGSNVYGQLGDGTTELRTLPVPVSGFNRFGQIDAFGSHNCGRTPVGDVLCWGYNREGQLGDGSTDNRAVPTPVTSARP